MLSLGLSHAGAPALHLWPAWVDPALLPGTSSPRIPGDPTPESGKVSDKKAAATCGPAWTPRSKPWRSLAPRGAVSRREGASLPP